MGARFGISTCWLDAPLGGSYCSVWALLGMGVVMVLLYDEVLFVLECLFECDRWFGVEAVTWFQVCGGHVCCNIAPL